MRTATGISLWIVRTTGIVQLVLGLTLWTGHGYGLVRVHILNGLVMVLVLWTLAVMALVAGVRRGLAVFAIAWGLALPALGFRQAALLVGPMHWVIAVIHLVMGLSVLPLAFTLGREILGAVPGRASDSDLEQGGWRRPALDDRS